MKQETPGVETSALAPPLRPENRLDPAIFQLPADAIRDGYYSDKYFVVARDVLIASQRNPVVTMQVFQKQSIWLCGIDEAIAILKLCLTSGYTFDDLDVRALRDGDRVSPWESVLHITGPYPAFAHLETLYLGTLARRTKITTNTRRVVEAAWPKPIMYFPARHDHWLMQEGDGYAANIAGATGVSTNAQGAWWRGHGIGTVPHSLIACFTGNTVEATTAVARNLPTDVRLISLVDFDNDCVATSLEVARALGPRLWGVRLDTAENMVDRSLGNRMDDVTLAGVNPQLVWNVRRALDGAGFNHVRIVVSGGFDAEKIERFEKLRVPVDVYGVGSSLIRGSYDFTADIVMVDGRPSAKTGREFRANERLERVV